MEDRDSLVEKIREIEKELVKHPFRTRQEIVTEIFESKMHMIGLEPSEDSGYIPLSQTPLARFLRSKGTPEEAVDVIIQSLQDESEESRMEIIETALEFVDDTHSWVPRHLKNRDDCRQWLEEVLERAKLPTEAINSILIGLERNLVPAKRELTRVLSRLGFSKFTIEWLIAKMSGSDDE